MKVSTRPDVVAAELTAPKPRRVKRSWIGCAAAAAAGGLVLAGVVSGAGSHSAGHQGASQLQKAVAQDRLVKLHRLDATTDAADGTDVLAGIHAVTGTAPAATIARVRLYQSLRDHTDG